MRPWAIFRRLDLALILLPLPAIAQCPAEGAAYRLAVDAAGALGEIVLTPPAEPPNAAALDLVLTMAGEEPVSLEVIQSQGYGAIRVFPRAPSRLDDLSDEGLPLALFADADGKLMPFEEPLLRDTTQAPDAIHIAGLGSALWYSASGDPVYVPDALWYRDRCGG